MQQTRVQYLGQEDPLQKEMAIHSSTLAWKTPWTEKPGGLKSMRSQRVGHDWVTSLNNLNREQRLFNHLKSTWKHRWWIMEREGEKQLYAPYILLLALRLLKIADILHLCYWRRVAEGWFISHKRMLKCTQNMPLCMYIHYHIFCFYCSVLKLKTQFNINLITHP